MQIEAHRETIQHRREEEQGLTNKNHVRSQSINWTGHELDIFYTFYTFLYMPMFHVLHEFVMPS
jgi:hypothetical protein